MAWTTTDLLADVRRRAMLPNVSTQGTTDADLLEYANNEMSANLVPLVMSVNEEFFVQTVDVATISGQYAYRLPNRNVGGKLRDVNYIMGAALLNLARIEPEQLTQFVVGSVGFPAGFYLESGSINLIPKPSVGGLLRFKHFVRPGRLITSTAQYGTITAVNYTGPDTVVLSVSGSSPFVPSSGPTVDVIAANPPFEYLLTNATVTSTVSGGTVDRTVTVTSPTSPPPNFSPNIQVGDYITQLDVSPVIQLPVELHSLLAQRIVCAVMESFGYQERWAQAKRIADEMEERALRLIAPRVDGAPKKMRGILNTHTRFGPGLR